MNKTQVAAKTHYQDSRQLVCFQLGGEAFGIDIGYVQDIHQLVKVTPVPQAPDFIEGVINLRGAIIPIIDLHQRFFNTKRERATNSARIIVLSLDQLQYGVIVDSVTQILRVDQERIVPPPELLKALTGAQFVESLATLDEEEILVILNPENLLKAEEKAQLEKLKGEELQA